MLIKEIHNLVEELAERLVLSETSDLQELAKIYGLLQEISNWNGEESIEIVTTVATKVAKLVEQIILDETNNGKDTLEIVNRGVSSLQALVIDGRDASEVEFPSELGIFVNRIYPSLPDSTNPCSTS